MGFNILTCDQACTNCVKSYKKKHDLKKGDSFKIACNGIPKDYIAPNVAETLNISDYKDALSILDPVRWAADVLDWHCSDPYGEIWKRKTSDGSLGEVTPYIEEKHSQLVKEGKSAFNREYQKIMLRCSAKRKVFRCGRQIGKSETICVSILYNACTNKDFRVIVITPYQTQIEVIFNRLSSLIKKSNVPNIIQRYVKAPNYTIELKNGSTIRGFTAGTKSGGNADAVRGQKANMLVFDEADYLSPEDMASALAVITNYPDATVWMSSTPTGKRERFYDSCHSHLYKEYYYPSMVNPLWSDDLEEFYRNEFTSIQYTHEIEADFGEQEQGVYQSAYVDEAMIDYKYEDQKRDPNWVYSIGVDWNDQKVGTTIAVVGYNPISNIFKLFTRDVVSREGWTQHAAIERIIEFNRYWLPTSIYIDKGYGHAQYEIIRKYGYDSLADPDKGAGHPDSRLQRITKQFDFGSKLTIKDPATKQDVDKPAKPFLVENSIRRFEQRQFHFSKYDKQLEAELRGYIIDHTTISGSPVYKQGNEKIGDHNLDAMNLALIAFTLEGSQFGKINFDSHIAFSQPIGQKKPQSVTPGRPYDLNNQDIQPQKPSMNRTDGMDSRSPSLQTPAHTNNTEQRRLWNWPGFERDAPRPVRQVPGGLSGRHGGPPSRKKF
jgi:replicative DNA helicase